MKSPKDGLVIAPQIHCFYEESGRMVREVLEAEGYPAASFVITLAEKIDGNAFAVALDLINKARSSVAFAIGLEIAMAHVVAAKTVNGHGSDPSDWLEIQHDLASDIIAALSTTPEGGAV